MSFPIVLKPINEGSSLGVKIIKNIKNLKKTALVLFKKYDQLLFEEYIAGQEIQAAVINMLRLEQLNLFLKDYFMTIKQNIQNLQRQSI